eukprot:764449-Hanusia_phi.AAC.5
MQLFLSFGDGNSLGESQSPLTSLSTCATDGSCLSAEIRGIDEAEDLVFALVIVEHTYSPSDGSAVEIYNVFFSGCCKPISGLDNSAGCMYKVTSLVSLNNTDYTESAFFAQTPMINVSLAISATLQLFAQHPTQDVTFAIGTDADFGGDTGSCISSTKGAPYDVSIDASSGLLFVPRLSRESYYSIVVRAWTTDVVFTTMEFYIRVRATPAGFTLSDSPAEVQYARKTDSFICDQLNSIVVRVVLSKQTQNFFVSNNDYIPTFQNVSRFGQRLPKLEVIPDTGGLLYSFTWNPPCESLQAQKIYTYRGRHLLDTFASCFQVKLLSSSVTVPDFLVSLSHPSCYFLPVIRCTTPKLQIKDEDGRDLLPTYVVHAGNSTTFLAIATDDPQTQFLDLKFTDSSLDSGGDVEISPAECVSGSFSPTVRDRNQNCTQVEFKITFHGALTNAGRNKKVCFYVQNDQALCPALKRISENFCAVFVVPAPVVQWQIPLFPPLPNVSSSTTSTSQSWLMKNITQNSSLPSSVNSLRFNFSPSHSLPRGTQVTISGLTGSATESSPMEPTGMTPNNSIATNDSAWVVKYTKHSSSQVADYNQLEFYIQPKYVLPENQTLEIAGLVGTRVVCVKTASWDVQQSIAIPVGIPSFFVCGTTCANNKLFFDLRNQSSAIAIYFPSIKVPYEGVLKQAILRLTVTEALLQNVTITIRSVNHVNPPVGMLFQNASTFTMSDAYVEWRLDAPVTAGTQLSIDLSLLFQEKIDHPYWKEDNAVAVFLEVISPGCYAASCLVNFQYSDFNILYMCPQIQRSVKMLEIGKDPEKSSVSMAVSWNQNAGVMLIRLPQGISLLNDRLYRFVFTVQNSLTAQPAPAVTIKTYNDSGPFCGRDVSSVICTSKSERFDHNETVTGSTINTFLLISAIRTSLVRQSTSKPWHANNLTIEFTSAVEFDEYNTIFLKGFHGILNNISFAHSSNAHENVFSYKNFTNDILSVTIKSGSKLLRNMTYSFSITVTNGGAVQDSQVFSILVVGLTNGDFTTCISASGDWAPLKIRAWDSTYALQTNADKNTEFTLLLNMTSQVIFETNQKITVRGFQEMGLLSNLLLENSTTTPGLKFVSFENAKQDAIFIVTDPLAEYQIRIGILLQHGKYSRIGNDMFISLGGKVSSPFELMHTGLCEERPFYVNSVAVKLNVSLYISSVLQCVTWISDLGILSFKLNSVNTTLHWKLHDSYLRRSQQAMS